jgi:hypothetical protein
MMDGDHGDFPWDRRLGAAPGGASRLPESRDLRAGRYYRGVIDKSNGVILFSDFEENPMKRGRTTWRRRLIPQM